jgi:hypothetical protein
MKYSELTTADFSLVSSQGKILLTLLELEKKQNIEVSIYCDSDNSFCCLLPVIDSNIQLPDINGLLIQYQDFKKIGSSKLEKYILIRCNHKVYYENFIQILKEILNLYDNTDFALCDCLLVVIAKWQHFLSEPKQDILDKDEIIGLIGELFFLDLILKKVNPSLIENWTADRGEEDFIYGKVVIEIKTTTKEKHVHFINGIDQLLVDSGKKKYILSQLLSSSGSGPELTLPKLINDISSFLSAYPYLVDLFFEKLKARKYDVRDTFSYEPFKYFIYRTGLFKVDHDFPKLTTKELSQPLNARISKLSYLLDMEGLTNLDLFKVDFNKFLK